jgi:hypothetical protein
MSVPNPEHSPRQQAHDLFLECLRLFLGASDGHRIDTLVQTGSVDWPEFTYQVIHHKCVGLAWSAFDRRDLLEKVPAELERNLGTFYQVTRLRNTAILGELERVLTQLAKAGVRAWPLKGSVLIPMVYRDRGIRTVNDLDLLVTEADAEAIHRVMGELGYGQHRLLRGDRYRDSKELVPGRNAQWQAQHNNFAPYHRMPSDVLVGRLIVDFSFNPSPTKEKKVFSDRAALERRKVPFQLGERSFARMGNEEFLIQVCLHLYKEATRIEWQEFQADLNMIKFLDVCAFAQAVPIDSDMLVEICRRENVLNEVLTALQWTGLAFGLPDFGGGIFATQRRPLDARQSQDFAERLWDLRRYDSPATRRALSNGKAERLRQWALSVGAQPSTTSPEPDTSAPWWEETIALAWSKAVRGATGTGNFFDLGGDSLDAIKLIQFIETLVEREVPLTLLVEPLGLDSVRRWLAENAPKRDPQAARGSGRSDVEGHGDRAEAN